MKHTIILLVLLLLLSCKAENANEFVTNTPSIVLSKSIIYRKSLKTNYRYGVKHRKHFNHYRIIYIYSNDPRFKVGDTLTLEIK